MTSSSTTGLAVGRVYNLVHLVNLAMEDIGKAAGQALLHVNVASSPYGCLSGVAVNVFSFQGQLYLHNGAQGPQCAYGTWEIASSSLLRPFQVPLLASAHLVAGPAGAIQPRLLLTGRSFGMNAGSVLLIGYSNSSAGPVLTTKVTSWAGTVVTANVQGTLAAGRSYYVLLVTSGGVAASALVAASVGVAVGHPVGAPPGTTVVLQAGSPLAKVGQRTVHLGAAPRVSERTLLAPLGVLLWLTGAKSRFDRPLRQLRVANAQSELVFQLGSRRYDLDGRPETALAAPLSDRGVLLVPLGAFAQAFGLSVRQGPGHSVVLSRFSPFESTNPPGGGGSGGGNGGSGSSAGSQTTTSTETRTITSVYGQRGQGFNYAPPVGTWCNVQHLGPYALGSCTSGQLSENNPGGGTTDVGTTVFGVAGGEADQWMGVEYTSQAPKGTTSTLSVRAVVDSADFTIGLSAAGGSCAPTEVNWSTPTGTNSDSIASCLGSFQVSVPDVNDVSTAVTRVLNFATSEWGNLSQAAQDCVVAPQQDNCTLDAVNSAVDTLMSVEDTGLSFNLHQSVFTWQGTTTGGSTSYFSVDPEVQVSDVGLGTEVNIMVSWAELVVSEQYQVTVQQTQDSYSWVFPVAEVGQPLFGQWLQACATPDPLTCQLVSGTPTVTSGNLPNGMSVTTDDGGYVTLAGAPSPGSEGTYQFTVQVTSGTATDMVTDIFACTIDVAPPLAMLPQSSTTTYYYETGVGFTTDKAFVLPFNVSGGVGGVTWALAGNPPWLGVASSPSSGPGPGSPPVLFALGNVPTSGTYTFTLQAWDYYTSVSSPPLKVVIVPKLSLVSGLLTAAKGQPFQEGLSVWASGGVRPLSWQVDPCHGCGTLPPGLQLSPTSGVITGTPEQTGDYKFVVAATDGARFTATALEAISVYAQPPPGPQPPSLPSGTVGQEYSAELQAGAGTPPFRWAVASGSLPPGLSLSVVSAKPWYGSKADISGTPTRQGSYSFSLRVTDGQGKSATGSYTVEISTPSPTTSTTCPPKICSPPKK
ncbi:MAG: putative Ig domain-containing protein [Acidimicrobiales bacterium]